MRSRDHIDLDVPAAQLWEHQWEQFLTEYYSLTQGGARIQVGTNTRPTITRPGCSTFSRVCPDPETMTGHCCPSCRPQLPSPQPKLCHIPRSTNVIFLLFMDLPYVTLTLLECKEDYQLAWRMSLKPLLCGLAPEPLPHRHHSPLSAPQLH